MIEDDQDLALLITTSLEKKLSCVVQIAHDPFEAINLMVENYYDLILLDWQLPGLNGIETLIKTERSLKLETLLPLKWDLKKVPVIILSSAKKNECLSRNTKHFNFLGHISKSQSLETIIESIGEYMNDEKITSQIA
jgi:CheY-like chemotaxis protein